MIKLTVDIGSDYITILFGDTEVVHWIMDEWIEDPDVVISIANAVHLAHTDPYELLSICGWIAVA